MSLRVRGTRFALVVQRRVFEEAGLTFCKQEGRIDVSRASEQVHFLSSNSRNYSDPLNRGCNQVLR